MTKQDWIFFEKNYQPVYLSGIKNGMFYIEKTRLPDRSDGFISENEDQAKKILIEKMKMDHLEENKKLNQEIEKCKKNKVKDFFYELFPFVHKRFYQQVSVKSNINEIEEKEKIINAINVREASRDLKEYQFHYLHSLNDVAFYLVVSDSHNGLIANGIHKILVKNLSYHIDEDNKQIRVEFNTYFNQVKIEGKENKEGEIEFVGDFDGNIKIFTTFEKARDLQLSYMETQLEKIRNEVNIKKMEMKNYQNSMSELKKRSA